ncbi:hypothetical protein KAJ27_07585, partial [bacterium]|nr:hypothetical protein [bacterium]
CILFGGSTGNNETWTWDGSEWKEYFPVTIPTGRSQHKMAYDENRQKLVMFGDQGKPKTWELEWSGAVCNWDDVELGVNEGVDSPQSREGFAMAYHAGRQTVMIYGGDNCNYDANVWEWNGTAWSQTGLDNTNGKNGSSMVYHPARGSLISFGGKLGSEGFSDSTWEWNDGWKLIDTIGPHYRMGPGLVYVTHLSVILLYGGGGGGQSDETWIFGR